MKCALFLNRFTREKWLYISSNKPSSHRTHLRYLWRGINVPDRVLCHRSMGLLVLGCHALHDARWRRAILTSNLARRKWWSSSALSSASAKSASWARATLARCSRSSRRPTVGDLQSRKVHMHLHQNQTGDLENLFFSNFHTSIRDRKYEEVRSFEQLPNHPNILRFFAAWEEQGHLFIQVV